MSPLGDNNLARRVLKNYSRPVDVHIPALWPPVKQALAYLDGLPGFRGLMLTGSMILRTDIVPKDLDIVLRFNTAADALKCPELPKQIAGIKTDFFYYIGEAPDVYFACLDCEARKLYVSSWLPLKINSIETGIDVIDRGTSRFGDCVKMLMAKDDDTSQRARRGWIGVVAEWRQLTKFVAAAQSRGIMATAKHALGVNETDGLRAPAEVVAERRQSCFAPCPVLIVNGAGQKFCGACGCGETTLARLDGDKPNDYTKLEYPHVSCPLDRPGFTSHEMRPNSP